MVARRLSAVYFALLGLGTLAWWIALSVVPEWQQAFVSVGVSPAELRAFAPGDLLLLVPAAMVAAHGIRTRSDWATAAAAVAVGASAYAAAYAVSAAIFLGGAPLAAALMAPVLIISPLALWASTRGR